VTAKQVLEALGSGVVPEPGLLRKLGREAALDRGKTAELFQDLVEPLSDSFDPEACEHYTAVFSEVIAELAPEFDAQQLRERYARISNRPAAAFQPETVFVLSRVTLGADIAITSVFIDAAKQAFPKASIVFVGNRKNAELWEADHRVGFLEAPYDRTGMLQGRIDSHRQLVALLNRPASIVIDPDSRLTQLGLIPVCPEDRYFFFNSRAYGTGTRLSISELAAQFAEAQFGVNSARSFIAPIPSNAEPRVTVSFGVGENPSKRVSEAFEITVLQQLVRLGAKVLVDQGAGGEEAERVKHAVRQTAGKPAQVEMFSGPFAAFAAYIAKSPLYIGYDSAGQHAAAALGVPSVTVFAGYPNERFLERWRPAGKSSRTLVASEPNLLDRIAAVIEEMLAVRPSL